MPRLEIQSGRAAGKILDLSGTAILGRGDTVELQIPDGKASREHCRIFNQGGQWVVADLNSRNGISVNGVKTTRKNLSNGDTIQIGETVIAFREGEVKQVVRTGPGPADTASDEDEIELDVVQPTARPAAAAPAAQSRATASRKPAGDSKRERAFAAARADSARRPSTSSGAGKSKGLAVKDDVLQFSRIDANKAGLFDLDLGQHTGLAQLLIWGGGIRVMVLVIWGILKVMGVTAG